MANASLFAPAACKLLLATSVVDLFGPNSGLDANLDNSISPQTGLPAGQS
jgi:hypothetical protein